MSIKLAKKRKIEESENDDNTELSEMHILRNKFHQVEPGGARWGFVTPHVAT